MNGVGKSTIGKKLAERLEYTFIDSEDLFFQKSDTASEYSNSRSKEEAQQILEALISGNSHFVFSTVRGDYGNQLYAVLDYVILIETPKKIRMQRVRDRSFQKYGERMLPGGDLFDRENKWFSQCESKPEEYVKRWIESIDCPVIRLDGTLPIDKNVEYLLKIIKNR